MVYIPRQIDQAVILNFFFIQYVTSLPQKMIYASFQIKKKSLVVMFEIGYLALKTVFDSFDIYTIHSLIKKIFETN